MDYASLAQTEQTEHVGTQPVIRVVAGLLAVFWGLLFFGLIDLLAFLQGPEFHATILLSTGWGLLFLFLVAGALAALCLGPSALSAAAEVQVAAVAVALLIAGILSAAPRYLLASAGVALTAVVIAMLRRGEAPRWRSSWRWSALPALVLAVAVLPLGYYSWISARNTGTSVVTDDTLGLDHWPAQAALPLAVLLIAAAAAGHPRGWRLLAWSVTTCGVWFAVVCWFEPHLVGSVARGWSVALAAWSLGFLAAAYASAPDRR